MTFSELGAIGELVGGITVVVTMIFVVFELRSNRRQNRLSMLTALDKGWNEICAQVASDGELGAIHARGMKEPESLSEEEWIRFFYLVVQWMSNHKSVWTLVNEEGLDTHHAIWLKYDISTWYNQAGIWKVFNSIRGTMPQEFIDYVELHRLDKVEPEWF